MFCFFSRSDSTPSLENARKPSGPRKGKTPHNIFDCCKAEARKQRRMIVYQSWIKTYELGSRRTRPQCNYSRVWVSEDKLVQCCSYHFGSLPTCHVVFQPSVLNDSVNMQLCIVGGVMETWPRSLQMLLWFELLQLLLDTQAATRLRLPGESGIVTWRWWLDAARQRAQLQSPQAGGKQVQRDKISVNGCLAAEYPDWMRLCRRKQSDWYLALFIIWALGERLLLLFIPVCSGPCSMFFFLSLKSPLHQISKPIFVLNPQYIKKGVLCDLLQYLIQLSNRQLPGNNVDWIEFSSGRRCMMQATVGCRRRMVSERYRETVWVSGTSRTEQTERCLPHLWHIDQQSFALWLLQT